MSKTKKKRTSGVDRRQQLFNEGQKGPIAKIQVSTERIFQLNGVLFDIDPPLYKKGVVLPKFTLDPRQFYRRYLKHWLDRNPTLAKCHVRMTGTGLHAILWFVNPVELITDADRVSWAAKSEVIQAALPIDPDQPGITATTRAIGSINSKNDERVVGLRRGTLVSQEEVEDLFDQMVSSPFKTVMNVLTGEDKLSPCPVCGTDSSQLRALDHAGSCYGSCGRIKLQDLYDLVLAPRKQDKK